MSGSGFRSGSRPMPAVISRSQVPAAIGCPNSSVSSVRMRPADSAGESKRRVSSIASGTRAGRRGRHRARRALVSNACRVLPIRSAVVMIPAPSMMMSRLTISSCESSPDSTNAIDEPTHGRSLRLGDALGEVPPQLPGRLDELGRAVALRVEHAHDSGERPDPELVPPIGLDAEEVAHHGHGHAVTEFRPRCRCGRSGKPSRASAVVATMVCSSPPTAGVKSTFTEPRMRVWSGGSM